MRSSSNQKTEVVPVKRIGRGGATPGAGRKKGTLGRRIKLIRDLSMKAMKEAKRVPLATMLKNMNQFDDEADLLYAEYQELKKIPVPKDESKKIKHFMKMMEHWSKTRECMLDAQKAAVDAAPFMHQRLSATDINLSVGVVTKPAGEMTEEQKIDYFNKLRLRPTSHVPLQITVDNETGDSVEEGESE